MRMKIVVTVSNEDEVRLAEKADIIEFRLDLGNFSFKTDKEKILTIRRKVDGGSFEGDENERLKKIVELSKLFEYVDLEVDVPEWVFEELKKNNKKIEIIESYHNFKETPNYLSLKDLVENRRGDILKIATLGKSFEDVKKITRILLDYEKVVAFLIGEKYSFTRVLSIFLGAPLIYCYVLKPKAPGQLELNFVYDLLKKVGLK
ncbi:MAG: type I 3-dehydroquinate dehydratase [Archaeoglobaceae archaeon]|nr:type I 3-dehydroquinate dehydratase [Archaeoglobaceae archaeon]MCX8152443.1 type I 3-dehydroquinate dehydratase [Archaeoglobaceae archaeon]MDW8013783.1 type I 3-dehydroquinate dehydratase [Archaeoglobaceae archaeon]